MFSRLAAATFASLLLLQPAQPQTDTATIRSTTRLVQVSVVALDNHGNPITGLTKDDFSVSDEGHPQPISIFTAETPASAALPAMPLPPNTFTNRFDLKGQDPGAVTIILFDALNTAFADQSLARQQILKFLQSLQPQDHVAIYALTTKLLILHDFTQDSAALVNAVNHFSPQELASFQASTQGFIDLVGISGNPDWAASPNNFQANLNNANGAIADQATINRVITTTSALEAIAGHVAIIPGRKSLVWVSGGFPLQLNLGNIAQGSRQATNFDSSSPVSDAISVSRGSAGGSNSSADSHESSTGSRSIRESSSDLNRAARALNRANLSIYPIDVHGFELNAGAGSDTKLLSNDVASTGFYDRQNRLDSFRLLADRTGGVAFYGNNDINAGIRRAFDDGRFAYTIGFYPDHNKWDGKFREIKIKVNTAGAQLRYRKGYFAVPELTNAQASQQAPGQQAAALQTAVQADLQQAAISPLESTSLGMVVVATPVQNSVANSPGNPTAANPNATNSTAANPGAASSSSGNPGATSPTATSPGDRILELRVTLDPKQFLLDISSNHRNGALDLMFLQIASEPLALSKEGLALSKGGLALSREGSPLISAEKQHLDINFDEKQFLYLSSAGMILLRHLTISPQTSEIRIIVRDANSGALGSVAIPASTFYPSTPKSY